MLLKVLSGLDLSAVALSIPVAENVCVTVAPWPVPKSMVWTAQ